MRWFTDSARADDGDQWESAVAAYADHVRGIAAKLPRDLAMLSSDPRLDLKDGRFREVIVDRAAETVVMTIDCGDLQHGYRRLTLHFLGATVVPDNLALLADAIGAEFRSNHWHSRTSSEVRAQEVDLVADGRYALRLRLWPFHEFAVECSDFRLEETQLEERGSARAGTFSARPEV